jgi:hypothetical protein
MIQVQTLFDDGDQHVSGDGSPYLRLDCVFDGAKERFDAQLLFDHVHGDHLLVPA